MINFWNSKNSVISLAMLNKLNQFKEPNSITQ